MSSSIRTYEDQWGYGMATFVDRETPPNVGKVEETPWLCFEGDKEEHVAHLTIGGETLKLAQSDIRALLPFLERFAKTGKLLEEKP